MALFKESVTSRNHFFLCCAIPNYRASNGPRVNIYKMKKIDSKFLINIILKSWTPNKMLLTHPKNNKNCGKGSIILSFSFIRVNFFSHLTTCPYVHKNCNYLVISYDHTNTNKCEMSTRRRS